jgi:Family of unknown function (DUF6152)
MKARLFMLALGTAVTAVNTAYGHHSFSIYDRHRTVTLSGVVKEYIWMAPHVTIRVASEGDRNNSVTWWVEGSSPAVLARGGWNGALLKPGDKISIGIHPRKDRTAGGLLADEQQMLVNGRPPKGVSSLYPLGDEPAVSDCAGN